jgi:hypothetical protein
MNPTTPRSVISEKSVGQPPRPRGEPGAADQSKSSQIKVNQAKKTQCVAIPYGCHPFGCPMIPTTPRSVKSEKSVDLLPRPSGKPGAADQGKSSQIKVNQAKIPLPIRPFGCHPFGCPMIPTPPRSVKSAKSVVLLPRKRESPERRTRVNPTKSD